MLAGELGYFIFLILTWAAITMLAYAGGRGPIFSNSGIGLIWPFLLYILVLPLNLFGGFAGIILNIRTNHPGYPGTGHLLNWIFITATCWLFILAIVFILPSMPLRF